MLSTSIAKILMAINPERVYCCQKGLEPAELPMGKILSLIAKKNWFTGRFAFLGWFPKSAYVSRRHMYVSRRHMIEEDLGG
jgi:hypothetical protein